MLNTIITFLPLTFLIAMAVITKKMAQSMILSTLLAIALVYKQNFLEGIINTAYDVLSDSTYQYVLLIMVTFGGLITLFQESGAMMGLRNLLERFANGPKKSLLLAWLMALMLFIDEYLNALTVTFSMREVTDRAGVPREHLAYQAHSLACCLCILIPFTSWTGFTVELIANHGLDFTDYVKSLPYMFFPLLTISVCFLMIFGLIPKVGPLKKAYERVAAGGPALLAEEKGDNLIDITPLDETKRSSALNAIIPLIALVSGVLIFDNDLIHGIVLALLVQFIMYIPQRIMSASTFFNNFLDGAKSMTTLGIVLGFGFMFSQANRKLGMFDILINGFDGNVPAFLIPAIAFILVGLTTFGVGSCWVVMTISFPIFIPVALGAGIYPPVIIAAIMSGITMGYSLCFYADTVFLATAGTGVSNITVIKTNLPYATVIIILTVAGLLAAGAGLI